MQDNLIKFVLVDTDMENIRKNGLSSFVNIGLEESNYLMIILLILRKEGLLGYIDNNYIEETEFPAFYGIPGSKISGYVFHPNKIENEDGNIIVNEDYLLINDLGDFLENLYLQNKRFRVLLDAYNWFKPFFKDFNPSYYKTIIAFFFRIDQDYVNEYFEREIDNLIAEFLPNRKENNYVDYHHDYFAKIISVFMPKTENISIYNPFALHAHFALNIDTDCKYLGQEMDKEAAVIGNLRLLLYNKPSNIFLQNDPTLQDWPLKHDGYQFDFITALPPKTYPLVKGIFPTEYSNYGEIHSFLLRQVIELLNDDGKAAIVVPDWFLESRKEVEVKIKKELIDKDYIDRVIKLPKSEISDYWAKENLLVLDMKKDVKKIGVTQFYNLEEKFESIHSLNIDEVIDFLSRDEYSKIMVSNNIISTDGNYYNLLPKRLYSLFKYFGLDNNMTQLNLVFKPTDRIFINPKSKLKEVQVIGYSELKTQVHFFASFENTKVYQVNSLQSMKIELSTLTNLGILLCKKHGDFHPVYYKKNEGQDIYCDSNSTFSLILTKEYQYKVDIEYLCIELSKDYVKEQIIAYSYTNEAGELVLDDLGFGSIKIHLPDLETQKARVSDYYINNFKSAIENIRTKGLNSLLFKELSELRHAIGRPLLNVNAALDNLKHLILLESKNYNVLEFDKIISDDFPMSIQMILESIENDISHVRTLLERSDYDINFDSFEIIPIDIVNLTNKLKDKIKMNYSKTEFELIINDQDNILNEETNILIMGNSELLIMLIDAVISNAIRHGFNNRDSNKLMIKIGLDNQFLMFELVNNGNDLPSNFTKDQFTQKGTYTGRAGNSGIGGYHINQIVKKFNGYFEILRNPIKGYSVSFKFSFPLL